MISLRNVTFSYRGGGFRLNVDHFDVEARERIAVVGPSGIGKTTLLNLIAGIATPERGEVRVDGILINELPDGRRRSFRASKIGFVFQDFALLDYLSVRENILYTCRISGALSLTPETRARCDELARAVGLGGKLAYRPHMLSHGEQQRVALCRAILSKPGAVLADEATGNLDPENKLRMLDLLFERAEDAGAAVVAVTHDHDLLSRFDRVVDFRDFRRSEDA